ncbi:hypothetical protein HK100_004489 [Physocladia obscura]|uniref:Uncharacterized protein n=1 Tax=Physocladia obscura TaxID=109957 RepID=A0AAD5SSU7_9FUNG|nr:hypothetical protein HK100_004489 [Physocladia obscura]
MGEDDTEEFFKGTGRLRLRAETGMDLYQRPGTEYTRNDAPLRTIATPEGAFAAAARITATQGVALGQFQQAGIVFGRDAAATHRNADWIKAGVERYNARLRASIVVTKAVSEWGLAPLGPFNRIDSDSLAEFDIRIKRDAGGTISIEMKEVASGEWTLLRESYQWGTAPAVIGVYCAAPIDAPPFEAEFSNFSFITTQ